ncbi:uncharacterized protein LOC131737707 [Acipenser ruthenus]|uniref:uncharacterized protein LOC131737707 n=1 Tax=Acipenser ruthenus TaxID=7906 RepID=UPI00274217E9|nr:uncharacterized protein LOC131737707 [Acipenser ruthenus]
MTSETDGLDVSFLNEEEADKILGVLERDEELKKAEKERIRNLQHAKKDLKWLKGVTGQWFEDTKKKKYKNEADVSDLLKQPLSLKVKNNTRADLKVSKTKSFLQREDDMITTAVLNGSSFHSRLYSFFTLKIPGKRGAKQPPSKQTSCNVEVVRRPEVQDQAEVEVNTEVVPEESKHTLQKGIQQQHFNEENKESIDLLLEQEIFSVLDDLDNKLAEEELVDLESSGLCFHDYLEEQPDPLTQKEETSITHPSKEKPSHSSSDDSGNTLENGTKSASVTAIAAHNQLKDYTTNRTQSSADTEHPPESEKDVIKGQPPSVLKNDLWPAVGDVHNPKLKRSKSLSILDLHSPANEGENNSEYLCLENRTMAVHSSGTSYPIVGGKRRQKIDLKRMYSSQDALRRQYSTTIDDYVDFYKKNTEFKPLMVITKETSGDGDLYSYSTELLPRYIPKDCERVLSPVHPKVSEPFGSRHDKVGSWLRDISNSNTLDCKTEQMQDLDSSSRIIPDSPQERPVVKDISQFHASYCFQNMPDRHDDTGEISQLIEPNETKGHYQKRDLHNLSPVSSDQSRTFYPSSLPYTSSLNNRISIYNSLRGNSQGPVSPSTERKPLYSPTGLHKGSILQSNEKNMNLVLRNRELSRTNSLPFTVSSSLTNQNFVNANAEPVQHMQEYTGIPHSPNMQGSHLSPASRQNSGDYSARHAIYNLSHRPVSPLKSMAHPAEMQNCAVPDVPGSRFKNATSPVHCKSPVSPSRVPFRGSSLHTYSPTKDFSPAKPKSPLRFFTDVESHCDLRGNLSTPSTPGLEDSRLFYNVNVFHTAAHTESVCDSYESKADNHSPIAKYQSNVLDLPDFAPKSLPAVPTTIYGSRLSTSSSHSSAVSPHSRDSEQLSPYTTELEAGTMHPFHQAANTLQKTKFDNIYKLHTPLIDTRSASERMSHSIAVHRNFYPVANKQTVKTKETDNFNSGIKHSAAIMVNATSDHQSKLPSPAIHSKNAHNTGGSFLLNKQGDFSAESVNTFKNAPVINEREHDTLLSLDSSYSPENTWDQTQKRRNMNKVYLPHGRQQGAPVSPHATENEKSSELRLFNKSGVGTESKVDQILNRTKLTFSDKWFEDEILTARKRSKTMFDASSKSLDLNYKNTLANKEFQFSYSDKNRNTLVNNNYTVQESNLDCPNNWSQQKNISFSESEDFQYNAYNINSSRSLKDISMNCNRFYSMDYRPTNNRSYSVNSYHNDRTSGYNRLSTATKVTTTMKQNALSKSHYKLPLYDPEDVENKKEFKTQQSGNNSTRHKSVSFCESEGMQNSTSGNILSSKSLKDLNVNRNHFFTTDYGLKHNRSYSVNSFSSKTSRCNRLSTGPKLCKSQSELLNYNPEDIENENEASHYRMSKANRNKNVGGKKRLPEISIYDEEQQAMYLDHIRKSLTVGRIWKPGCLQNPSSPNNEEPLSRERVVLLGSTSTGSRTASQDSLSPSGQMPSRSYLNSLSDFVESDSDTTTDDEYYLNVDENDKESEL